MGRSIGTGIATAVLGVFPVTALVARFYRFPIPFAGYEGGPDAVPRALVAVLAYGLLGGFLVLAALGAAAGAAAELLMAPGSRRARWLTITFALAGAVVAVLSVAALDQVIGPW